MAFLFTGVGVKMSDDGSGATVTFENGINLQVTSTDNDVMNIIIVVPHKFRGEIFLINCTNIMFNMQLRGPCRSQD